MMKKKNAKGSSSFWSLVLLASLVVLVLSVAYDYLTASAPDVQEVVTLSNSSADAAVKMREFLSKNPTPNNLELKNLKKELNELVVRDLARKVTGNPSLISDSEKSALNKAAQKDSVESEQAKLQARFDSVGFYGLSMGDKAALTSLWLINHWNYIFAVGFFVFVLIFGFRQMSRAQHGY